MQTSEMISRAGRVAGPIFGAAAVALGAGAARAQEAVASPPPLPDPLTPETIRELVATLSDAEVRGLLLDRLDAVAQAQAVSDVAAGPGMGEILAGVGAHALAVASNIGVMLGDLGRMIGALAGGSFAGGLMFLVVLGLAAGLGMAARLGVARGLGRVQARPGQHGGMEAMFGPRAGAALGRFLRGLLGILAFAVAAGAVNNLLGGALLDDPRRVEASWKLLFAFGVSVAMVALLLDFALAPGRPEQRCLSADDATAKRVATSFIWLAVLMAVLSQTGQLQLLFGLDIRASGYATLANFAFCLVAIGFVWRERTSLAAMMAAPGEATAPGSWPHLWPRLAMLLIGLQWLISEILLVLGHADLIRGQGKLTVVIVLLLPGIDSLIRAIADRMAPEARGEGEGALRAAEATGRAYLRIGRVFVYLALVLLIARLWGLSLFGLAATGVGAGVATGLVKFLSICGVGYLIYELVNVQINLRLSREMTGSAPTPEERAEAGGEGGPPGGMGASRLATVLPLIRWVALGSIIGFTLLLAMSQAGVDIAPLLAGAGVFGLAIGFGAQTLVKDVVSGLFFLVDDAFRQGEYIDVGGTLGTVEKISIRSVQLRHHRGAVHTIPYGEIAKVTNFSRDWVIVKLKFTVPFGTDPNKVKKIFKTIGKDMEAMPEFKNDFMQPFKSQGVLEFDDVGIVLRGKFMARPGTQFMIRKEIFNRIHSAFAEAGIEFARREVRVRVNENDDGEISGGAGDARDRQVAAAAAADAANRAAQQPG